MLDVPEQIKELYKMDGIPKNFRVSFVNGEYPDMTNADIESESVKFTESMQSGFSLKFGLAESSSLEFTCHHPGGLLNKLIRAGIEVFIDDYVHTDYFNKDSSTNAIYIPTTYHITGNLTGIQIYFKQPTSNISTLRIKYKNNTRLVMVPAGVTYCDVPKLFLSDYSDIVDYDVALKIDWYSNVGIELDKCCVSSCDFTLTDSVYYRDDIKHYVYYIPYGVFKIQSSKKGATPTVRSVVAYQYDAYNVTTDQMIEFNEFEKTKFQLHIPYGTQVYNDGEHIPQVGGAFGGDDLDLRCMLCGVLNSIRLFPIKSTLDLSDYIGSESGSNLKRFYVGDYILNIVGSGSRNAVFRGYDENDEPINTTDIYYHDMLSICQLEYIRNDEYVNLIKNTLYDAWSTSSSDDVSILDELLDQFEVYTYPYIQFHTQLNVQGVSYPQVYDDKTAFFRKNNPVFSFSGIEYLFFMRDAARMVSKEENTVTLYIPNNLITGFSIENSRTGQVIYDSGSLPSLFLYDKSKIALKTISFNSLMEFTSGDEYFNNYLIYTRMVTHSNTPYPGPVSGNLIWYWIMINSEHILDTQFSNDKRFDSEPDYSPAYNVKSILNACLELELENGYVDRFRNELKCIQLSEKMGLYPDVDVYPSHTLFPRTNDITVDNALLKNVWWDDELIPVMSGVHYEYSYKLTLVGEGKTRYTAQGVYLIEGIADNLDNRDYLLYNLDDNFLMDQGVRISDIPRMQNEFLVYMNNLCDSMHSQRYRRAKIVMKGLPYMELGDTIVVLTQDSGFNTYILRRTLTGVQSLTDTIEVN